MLKNYQNQLILITSKYKSLDSPTKPLPKPGGSEELKGKGKSGAVSLGDDNSENPAALKEYKQLTVETEKYVAARVKGDFELKNSSKMIILIILLIYIYTLCLSVCMSLSLSLSL